MLVIFTTSQQSMINNEAIQVEELIVYGDKNMNRIAKQFSDQNNLTSFGKNFWRKTYNGKSPTQELLKVATEDLVQHKMIKQLATELEIAHSQTFGQEKRMARPKEQFNALAIFRCKRSTITGPNKREINGERKANAKELRQAFEQLDDKYKKTDYFVEAIEIPNFSGKQAELEKIASNLRIYLMRRRYWSGKINYLILLLNRIN